MHGVTQSGSSASTRFIARRTGSSCAKIPTMGRMREALAEGPPPGTMPQVALDLALDFHAWRRLARRGLSPEEAAEVMVAALRCQ